MTSSAQYREMAEKCLQVRRGTELPEVRTRLLRMALHWEELAEDSDNPRRVGKVLHAMIPADDLGDHGYHQWPSPRWRPSGPSGSED